METIHAFLSLICMPSHPFGEYPPLAEPLLEDAHRRGSTDGGMLRMALLPAMGGAIYFMSESDEAGHRREKSPPQAVAIFGNPVIGGFSAHASSCWGPASCVGSFRTWADWRALQKTNLPRTPGDFRGQAHGQGCRGDVRRLHIFQEPR